MAVKDPVMTVRFRKVAAIVSSEAWFLQRGGGKHMMGVGSRKNGRKEIGDTSRK